MSDDKKVLSSVWAALCANYVGTNIQNTLVQLLSMYRPEDGMEAYEKLLKTVIVLLKDCDNNDLENFISMIPPPLGISKQIAQEIFFNTAGFVRIDGPIFYQDSNCFPHEKNIIKNEDKSGEINNMCEYPATEPNNFVDSEAVSVPGFINRPIVLSQQPYFNLYSFQEFSTSGQPVYTDDADICFPHYLNRNHSSSQYYSTKQQPNSLYLSSMNCRKIWDINQVPLFVKNRSIIQSNFSYHNLLIKTIDDKYSKLPTTSCKMTDFNQFQKQELSKKMKSFTNANNSSSNSSQKIIKVPKLLNNFGYKKSSKKELNNFKEYNHSPDKKNVEFNDGKHNCPFFLPFTANILETLTINNTLKICIENLLNRLKRDVFTNESADKNLTMSTLIEIDKLSFCHQNKKTKRSSSLQRKNYFHNKLEIENNNLVYQTTSTNKLTACKQQYYDALLCIQRAKMAVVNSLTFSTTQSYDNCDPFLINCRQKPFRTTQQPQIKTIHKSPNYQKFFYSRHSHAENSYMRISDWDSSEFTPGTQQEFPFSHALPVYESHYMSNFSSDTSRYADLSSSRKTTVKKQKLNNSTIELMKIDANSIMHH